MKTVMTTFLSSIMTVMTVTKLRATGGRSHIEALCSILKLTEDVSTEMTKNMVKTEAVCPEREQKYKKPSTLDSCRDFYHYNKFPISHFKLLRIKAPDYRRNIYVN